MRVHTADQLAALAIRQFAKRLGSIPS